ncbi:MAG: DUF4065 domain-containing protein [Acidobacteria bacterium]|nr:DUF4065 domain-containing protein [Acidobacteriota bacterium]
MQLLKLAYLCHGWMLGLCGRPLLSDRVEAWQYGPVVPKIYHQFKKYKGAFISEVPGVKPSGFSPDEESIMDQVWEQYGHLTGPQLSTLTHQSGTPWDITIRVRGQGSTIPNDLIEQHYRALTEART